jgi:hypothetical protein
MSDPDAGLKLIYVEACLDIERVKARELRRAIKLLRAILKAPSSCPSYIATALAMTEHYEGGEP